MFFTENQNDKENVPYRDTAADGNAAREREREGERERKRKRERERDRR